MQRTDFEQLSRQTAEKLGTDWAVTCETDYAGVTWWSVLTHPAGPRIVVSPHWQDAGRVVVTGRYPPVDEDTQLANPAPRITVRANRGPAVLAREITRRFMPPYLKRIAEMRVASAQRDKRQRARAALIERLTVHLPNGADVSEWPNASGLTFAGYGGEGHLEVFGPDAPVHLDMKSVPLDVAQNIMRLLGQAIRKQAQTRQTTRPA
ncbi:hypothetical protein [Streptomyces sp. B6B3]|uniref:hypothetical protein n=1 Tax=Streptomyces sp. B6B3 TaxID=3153570 RepID=UPI00325C8F1F